MRWKELSASADERGIPMYEPEARQSAIEGNSRLNEEDGSIRHLPPEMVTAHLGLDRDTVRKIPAEKFEVLAG